MTLYAATTNAGKLREFAECAITEALEVQALPALASMPEPVEDAPSFLGNAELKAKAYSLRAPGLLVFADDSGLEVQALGGDPGIRSARFADDLDFKTGSGLSRDERNNQCLLSLLQRGKTDPESHAGRQARFICALALARDGQVLLRSQGAVEGEILDAPLGFSGFGYDPLFFMPKLGKSMAELSRVEKWAVSHRGLAFRDLLRQVRSGSPSLIP
ncbi:MAG: non-canonical purine NTP pyrophosphatase [Janthinobacterium lividum]